MNTRVHVRIRYYRREGQFLFFRIKTRCRECDLTYAVLNRLTGRLTIPVRLPAARS